MLLIQLFRWLGLRQEKIPNLGKTDLEYQLNFKSVYVNKGGLSMIAFLVRGV